MMQTGGQELLGVAAKLEHIVGILRRLDAGHSKGAASVDALLDRRDGITDLVARIENRFRVTGGAMVDYARAVADIQSTTVDMLSYARNAVEDRAHSLRLAREAAAEALAHAGSEADREYWLGQERRHRGAVAEYDETIRVAVRVVAEQVNQWEQVSRHTQSEVSCFL